MSQLATLQLTLCISKNSALSKKVATRRATAILSDVVKLYSVRSCKLNMVQVSCMCIAFNQ